MLIAMWIVTGLLAAFNLIAGLGKATMPWPKLQEKMPWTETTGKGQAYAAAWAEVVGGVGVIVPNVLAQTVAGWEWAAWVSFAAAIGLLVVQVLAMRLHLSRREPIVPNLVISALAIASAVLIAVVAA